MSTLPNEDIKDRSWGYVAKVVAITLTIVFAANGAAFYYINAWQPNLLYHLVKVKWGLVDKKASTKDWLVLGDSSCNQGVDPDVVYEILQEDALNLCVVGDYLSVGSSWLLDAYIRKNGAPDNILLVYSHRVWDRKEQPLNMIEQGPYRFILNEQLGDTLKYSVLERIKLEAIHYFPLAVHTASIREFLSNPANPVKHKQKYTVHSNGFMEALNGPSKDWLQKEYEILEQAKAYRSGLEVSPANLSGLKQIYRLADENNIEVYIASAPVYEKRYNNADTKAYFAQIDSFIAHTADTYGWQYIKIPGAVFSDSYMEDEVHLTYQGARLYTERLFTAIKEQQNHAH